MRIRLKAGMTDKLVAWVSQVPGRMDEVEVSMREQGIIAEHIYLERSPDGDSIIFYVKAEDLAKTRDVFQNSTRSIDQEMIEICNATWDTSDVTRFEPVLEL
jgi:hypothetical protein